MRNTMRTGQLMLLGILSVVAIIMGCGVASADLVVPGATQTDYFGSRDGKHTGEDWAAPVGSSIVSTTDGEVIYAGPAGDCGNQVKVQNTDGSVSGSCHSNADGLLVQKGDHVTSGQTVALVGMAGDTTGPHAHIFKEIDGQKVNPNVSALSAPAQPEVEAPAPAPAPEPEPAPMVEQTTVIQTGQHDWSGVVQCESSGNWGVVSSDGFEGGLQFLPSTWEAYGGTGSAADASPEEQIRVAENVLAGQGVGAWPVCGKHLVDGTTPVETTTMVPSETAPAPQAEAIPAPGPQLPEAQIIPDVLPADQDQALQTYVDNGVQQAEAWANGTGNPVVEDFIDNATTAITNAVDTFTNGNGNAPAIETYFELVAPQAAAIPQWIAPEPAPMPIQTVDVTQVADFAKTVAPQAAPMIDNFAAQANALLGQFMVGVPAAP